MTVADPHAKTEAGADIAASLDTWIGRTRVVEDEIGLTAVRRIAGMLDLDPAAFRPGTALPPHWFTMFFADIARHAELRPDGHPCGGVFLPPIPLPRRMGAGRRVTMPGRLLVGEAATKTAEVAAIVPKQGRSGAIVVLTMRHTIRRGSEVVAVDEFDAVYREAVPPGTASTATPPVQAPGDAAWSEQRLLDPALVFRYSAVTWNAHRIHYDADYARQEEGYPAAVQNGGLTMQLLLDAAARQTTARLTGFTARLTRPVWVGDTVTLAGSVVRDGAATAWVADRGGNLCASLDLAFAA